MKNKSTFIFVTVIMTLLVIYALVSNVILPVITQNQVTEGSVSTNNYKNEDQKSSKKKKSAAVESVEGVPDSLKTGSSSKARTKLFNLKKEEKFLQAKLSLVDDDSTYFVLDLSKKTAVLELKGVSLHESKILKYDVSSNIKNQPADALLNWLSKPFFLREDSASIPKISFIVKIAPKDSIEANKYEALPTPPKRGDVYAVMDFERGLRLIIRQAEKPDPEGQSKITRLQKNYTRDEITKSINALIHFNREMAIPTIDIVLSKDDATIFYRSLPFKPKLVVKL